MSFFRRLNILIFTRVRRILASVTILDASRMHDDAEEDRHDEDAAP